MALCLRHGHRARASSRRPGLVRGRGSARRRPCAPGRAGARSPGPARRPGGPGARGPRRGPRPREHFVHTPIGADEQALGAPVGLVPARLGRPELGTEGRPRRLLCGGKIHVQIHLAPSQDLRPLECRMLCGHGLKIDQHRTRPGAPGDARGPQTAGVENGRGGPVRIREEPGRPGDRVLLVLFR